DICSDVSQNGLKALRELPEQEFQHVSTLGERATSYNRNYPGAGIVHWRFDHPVGLSNDLEKQLREFRIVRDQILQRLRLFVLVHSRPRVAAPVTSLSMVRTAR